MVPMISSGLLGGKLSPNEAAAEAIRLTLENTTYFCEDVAKVRDMENRIKSLGDIPCILDDMGIFVDRNTMKKAAETLNKKQCEANS